jgi:hypothetical protein
MPRTPANGPADAEPAETAAPAAEASPFGNHLVKARWVDDNPAGVFNPEQGLIRYGDAYWVTAEQVEQDYRLADWDEAWRPDPKIVDLVKAFDNPEPATREEA